MDVQIYAHLRAENYMTLNPQQWDVICITGSADLVPKDIQRYSKSYLHIVFDDIDFPLDNYAMPLRVDVQKALEYADGKKKLIVCCQNGFSRSAAIAYAVKCQECREPKDAIKILIGGRDYPNRLVVEYAAEILGNENINKVFKEWLKKPKLNGKSIDMP